MTSKQTSFDINTAKEELLKINRVLERSHLLIGGLAVNQYNTARDTKDIDLVCESSVAKKLISELYPNKNYDIKDINDDELRPAWEITHKINKNKIIFFGPKIMERESYRAVDWTQLLAESQPFHYRKQECENVRVPSMESLAFLKLLSFVDRSKTNADKGNQDLIDFITLTNANEFKINHFTNLIRASSSESYIHEGMILAKKFADNSLWENSLLLDLFSILFQNRKDYSDERSVFSDNYAKIYKTAESIDFYDKIADKYDIRNTKVVLNTHRKVIEAIDASRLNNSKFSVLDIGSGTGRLIANQYYGASNIEWHCVEPSKQMRVQFSELMHGSTVKTSSKSQSIFDLKHGEEDKTFDVVIISLVLSSLPQNPDFGELAKFVSDGGKLIITDFYESCPYYDFELGKDKIALYTRRLDLVTTLKQILSSGLELESLDSIENPAGLENTFIMLFGKNNDSKNAV